MPLLLGGTPQGHNCTGWHDLRGLRELYGMLDEDLFVLSGRAIQIVEWDRTHQYCGHCATPTTQLPMSVPSVAPSVD
jgi:NAD+ diphosphatase